MSRDPQAHADLLEEAHALAQEYVRAPPPPLDLLMGIFTPAQSPVVVTPQRRTAVRKAPTPKPSKPTEVSPVPSPTLAPGVSVYGDKLEIYSPWAEAEAAAPVPAPVRTRGQSSSPSPTPAPLLDVDLEADDFVFMTLDCETTGLTADDRIIQLAAKVLDSGPEVRRQVPHDWTLASGFGV
jgi:hypothetical protein